MLSKVKWKYNQVDCTQKSFQIVFSFNVLGSSGYHKHNEIPMWFLPVLMNPGDKERSFSKGWNWNRLHTFPERVDTVVIILILKYNRGTRVKINI